MSPNINDLFHQIVADEWRSQTHFTPEIAKAHEELFSDPSDDNIVAILNMWLHRHQPCIFGRFAARNDLLSYCILRERDFARGDEAIREKIQDARLRWTSEGFQGTKSGFIVFLLSPRLASARPDEHVKRLAQRLCSLYLLTDVTTDAIHLEETFLEKPGGSRRTWKWLAGVNYFSAQADGRWWHDHRIPGGLALSVNSVGHLVKSGKVGKAMRALSDALGEEEKNPGNFKIDSLTSALELAMRTIASAHDGPSGPATSLLPLPDASDAKLPRCPFSSVPKDLQGKDYASYVGWYHTDVTLPSEYFRPDIERPHDTIQHQLDFTYLFDASVSNPDFTTMGDGKPIRGDGTIVINQSEATVAKRLRSQRRSVSIVGEGRLLHAL